MWSPLVRGAFTPNQEFGGDGDPFGRVVRHNEAKEHSVIAYVDSVENVATENLQGFFVGWPNPPSAETHLKLLASSDRIVLAVDDGTGKVVGFITAISDGILSAYIPLLEVLPAYQKRGIGQELVQRMLGKLKGLYMVDLFCDPELETFYSRFGMRPGFGMMLRNYERQSLE